MASIVGAENFGSFNKYNLISMLKSRTPFQLSSVKEEGVPTRKHYDTQVNKNVIARELELNCTLFSPPYGLLG
ncbi:hypothetical protein PRUPE_5G113100 [Prunus persica]|uniref:Uncharacterized protein n=1 Tax=Prunus persica TaxID=3760 RepID=M5WB89_PRUPE|nr:hypothetical protein PRUPE_5G113100 [Prunus persica]